MTRPELRKAVRRAMRDAGIPTVTALVKQAEITRNTLYNWEGGKSSPALDELEKVARVLDVPLSLLVDAWSGRDTEKEALPRWAEGLERRLLLELRINRSLIETGAISDELLEMRREIDAGRTEQRRDGERRTATPRPREK
jgi:transcriptional regulator with XRE-family HTH domain